MTTPVFEVRQFAKKFGKKQVHRSVNFKVFKGECLGLIGGSGSGKSVLLRSLIGLEKPDHGEVIYGTHDIVPWSEEELIEVRKEVAYVFQNGALFDSMSVFDNLAYPLREHTDLNAQEIAENVLGQLEKFGLSGCEDSFPADLSGGMQKRVGLARSIILRPKVVLFDEPTAGLDPYNTLKIQEVVLRLKKSGMTSIFVTHDMPSAMAVCDRVALLHHGTIAATGSVEDLKNDPNSLLQQFVKGRFEEE